jgi:hypothetical protein
MKEYKNFSLITEYSEDVFSTEIHDTYVLITYLDNTQRKVIIKKGISKGNRKIQTINREYDDLSELLKELTIRFSRC